MSASCVWRGRGEGLPVACSVGSGRRDVGSGYVWRCRAGGLHVVVAGAKGNVVWVLVVYGVVGREGCMLRVGEGKGNVM